MNGSFKFIRAWDYDEFKALDDFLMEWSKPSVSSHRLKIFDENDYDLVAKPHVHEKRLKELNRELESLNQVFEMQKKVHDEQVKKVELDIEQTKQKNREEMRFTIDTTAKTIEIDGQVNIKELTDALKKYLGDEWKEYAIKDNTETKWYYYPTW